MTTAPAAAPGWNIVLHDTQTQQHGRFWNPKARRPHPLPEPFRFQSVYGHSNVMLTDPALDYVAIANDQDPKKVQYVLRKFSGWINSGSVEYKVKLVNGVLRYTFKTSERQKAEYVVFGGNAVYVTSIKNDQAFIEVQHVDKPMPMAKAFPPIHRFYSLDEFDTLAMLPYNAVLFARPDDVCWIDTSRLRSLE